MMLLLTKKKVVTKNEVNLPNNFSILTKIFK